MQLSCRWYAIRDVACQLSQRYLRTGLVAHLWPHFDPHHSAWESLLQLHSQLARKIGFANAAHTLHCGIGRFACDSHVLAPGKLGDQFVQVSLSAYKGLIKRRRFRSMPPLACAGRVRGLLARLAKVRDEQMHDILLYLLRKLLRRLKTTDRQAVRVFDLLDLFQERLQLGVA